MSSNPRLVPQERTPAVIRTKSRVSLVRAIAILMALEVLTFILGFAFGFIIGASNGGTQEGFRMALGVLFNWFAFVVLGVLEWVVCIGYIRFIGVATSQETRK